MALSKRTTGKTPSDSSTPAPRRRKAAEAETTEAPKTTRSRRKVTATVTSEATDVVVQIVRPSSDEIATRAYFIALERGFQGDPVADWLQAEQQLREVASS
jgi:hypothetical protein